MAETIEDATQAPVVTALPMVSRKDPQVLAAERATLVAANGEPPLRRALIYTRLSGPGWLQGAMTLGGGTAAASLFAGSLLGYRLLWLQPVAMLTGIIMLNALAYQTLSTEMRPFHAFRRFVHPAMAWGWALAALLASIVWHFPQYNLSAAVIANMAAQAGADLSSNVSKTIVCFCILILVTAITWTYNRGSRFMRAYENIMKFFVAVVIISFAAVAFKTGIQWGPVMHGFFGEAWQLGGITIPFGKLYLPWGDERGMGVLIAAFAAAVGINMTFLLPYSMLARGWGREHRPLARFDLSIGLFLPFVLATTFVIIAAANVVHPNYVPGTPPPTAIAFAGAIEPVVGRTLSHWVFGLGILGMTMSTIPLHMLVCGFIAVEIFNVNPTGWGYWLATLIPAPAFLAPLLWGKLEFWLAVPTSVLCFILLPIAYVGFWVLHNSLRYLGADRPEGTRRLVWNVLLGIIVVVVTSGSLYLAVSKSIEWIGKLTG